MCTSFVVNKRKTLVGWNLDILDMIHRVRTDDNGVYIEILDEKEGWLPLFGANSRGILWECPTVVSMVFDVNEMIVYWCENRQWDKIESKKFSNRK